MTAITMYRNARIGISRWIIWQEGNTILMTSESKIGDSPMLFTEVVYGGKAGRTVQQQIDLRIKARVRGKVDNGYVYDIDDAKKPLTNQYGLYKPMLAIKHRDAKNLNINKCYVQPKLDGHRCLMTNFENEILAYSRAGRWIDTMEHIKKDLILPEGMTLDGEVYAHGQSLQVISSWAKRQQLDSHKLTYVVYDIIDPDATYEERLEQLAEIGLQNPHLIICPTWKVSEIPDFNLSEFLHDSIFKHGYEGLMLRPMTGKYEIGRRSKTLIKVKRLDDDEAVVTDVTPSKDGWGVLHCIMPSGKEFKMSAPGTVFDKTYVLAHKDKYIGRTVTYEFAQMTNDGKPFHAVALRWREDL